MRYVLASLILLSGCSSNYKMEGVNNAFPNAEVAFTPTQHQDFIVRTKDGSIWYVRSDNPFNNSITSKSLLFRGNNTK